DKDAPPLSRVVPPIAVAALAVGLIGWESLSQGAASETGSGVQTLIGLACALAALLSWSAFAVGNSRWMARLPAVSPHDWSLLTGVVTGGFALLLAGPALLTMGVWSGEAWMRFLGVSVGVAIFASIVGNAFWNQASRLLPLTMLGQMIVSETLFAFLYGFLWEGRGPTVIEIVAMILMVVSVVWCVRAHRPAAIAAAEGEH
ncbi:MAG: EamA/RhaT family transporter, partial [Brevundimonas sp.]